MPVFKEKIFQNYWNFFLIFSHGNPRLSYLVYNVKKKLSSWQKAQLTVISSVLSHLFRVYFSASEGEFRVIIFGFSISKCKAERY